MSEQLPKGEQVARARELFLAASTGTMSDAERSELFDLQSALQKQGVNVAALAEEVELAIGEAIAAMNHESKTAMPGTARDRLAMIGEKLVTGEPSQGAIPMREAERPVSGENSGGSGGGSKLGWAVAAAAVVIAAFGWLRTPPAKPIDALPQAKSLAQQRAELETDPATHKLAWTKGSAPEGAAIVGDVVWNNVRQEGYVRFRGAARNDPSKEQFQLWIFDKQRDDKYPIDGGVFDLDQAAADASGDIIVKITPKLKVLEPAMFAVTLEKPGGVVVTSRERLVLLAKPDEKKS